MRPSGNGWREAGHRGARRLLGLEDGLRQPRPRARSSRAERRRPDSRRARARTRVPGKNVRELAGHPLIAYTIAAARESGVFDAVVVSTDGEEIAARRAPLRRRGARPAAGGARRRPARPTSSGSATRSTGSRGGPHVRRLLDPAADEPVPGRGARSGAPASALRRGWATADSLRAVELCRQHPGKMWVRRRRR